MASTPAVQANQVRATGIGTLLLWLAPLLVGAVALARLSVIVQAWFAQLLLFPLAVGASLALAALFLARLSGWNGRAAFLLGTLLAGAVLIVHQHLFYYLDYRARHARQLEANAQTIIVQQATDAFAPASFPHYMRAQATPQRMGLWIFDAIVTLAAAGLIAARGSSSLTCLDSSQASHAGRAEERPLSPDPL